MADEQLKADYKMIKEMLRLEQEECEAARKNKQRFWEKLITQEAEIRKLNKAIYTDDILLDQKTLTELQYLRELVDEAISRKNHV